MLSGFGFTGKTALLYQMPIGAAQLVFVIVSAFLSSKLKSCRIIVMVFLNTISIIGGVMMFAPDKAHLNTKYAGFCLVIAYVGNTPLMLSITASNVSGFSKKATANAMFFLAYCIGNIAGPQFYITTEAPTYPVSQT